jgi:hypothetical protein
MAANPLDAVLDKIVKATVKANMWCEPDDADNLKEEEWMRAALVEAIAIKSLDHNHDTSPLFTEMAEVIPQAVDSSGRHIDPSEFDKIVGNAVKAFREEQLLGSPTRSTGQGR